MATIKWFNSGWYLTSGPPWKSEAEKATELCIAGKLKEVSLHVSPSGMELLNCKYKSSP